MAARQQNGKKRSGSAKGSAAKKKQAESEIPFLNEVVLLAILAICILLLLSNFGAGGVIGAKISGFFFGLFGLSAYLLPICVFVGAAFYMSNKRNRIAVIKLVAAVLFVMFFCLFVELVVVGKTEETIAASFTYGAEHKNGGGIVGGCLSHLLIGAFGVIGAYVVDIIVLIISLVLITERSFLGGVKKSSKKVYDTAKEDAVRCREHVVQKREERARMRLDRKVEGVAVDTKIVPPVLDFSDNLSELKPVKQTPQFTKNAMEKLFLSQKTDQQPVLEQERDTRLQGRQNGEHETVEFPRQSQSAFTGTEQGVPSVSWSAGRDEPSSVQGSMSAGRTESSFDETELLLTRSALSMPVHPVVTRREPSIVVQNGSTEEAADKTALYDGGVGRQQIPSERAYAPDDLRDETGSEETGGFETGSDERFVLHAEYGVEPEERFVPPAAYEIEAEPEDVLTEDALGLEVRRMIQDENADFGIDDWGKTNAEEGSIDFSQDIFSQMEITEEDADRAFAAEPILPGDEQCVLPADEQRVLPDDEQAPVLPADAQRSAQPPRAVRMPQEVKRTPVTEPGASERFDPFDSAEPQMQQQPKPAYRFPPTSLLKAGNGNQGDSQQHLQETALKLQQTLKNFGVNVTITDVSCGPSVTRYELQPEMGVKVSKIVNLADDIKLNLAAADIRIEAPIPGKAAVGIEVPNKETVMVRFRDMVEADAFKNHASSICFTAGKDIAGQVVVADIAKMPHLLIAGATGSGKSVCINTIIMSILYKANPEDVKLILIDPKVVELSVYNGIPHLFIPVVTDPKKAAGALHWAVAEMTERYQKFAEYQVRDLKGYNKKVEAIGEIADETKPQKMPQIVIVVDELADLMMVAAGEVEDAICRLAQLARAAGIHMIIATQRPSVDVITGLIKANMPSRIAFSVSSGVDSRTILDMNGAEKLLGNGDMLFYPQGIPKPVRVQGPFVSDGEVEAVVDFLKEQNMAVYNAEIEAKMNTAASGGGPGGANERDDYFVDAGKFVIEKDKGSIGMLQRWFKVGFNRAARIMDQLEQAGVVGPEEGTKPRRVLMSMEQFEAYVDEFV